ncbi:hypothetical protein D3C73_1027580 [compost metagenome]
MRRQLYITDAKQIFEVVTVVQHAWTSRVVLQRRLIEQIGSFMLPQPVIAECELQIGQPGPEGFIAHSHGVIVAGQDDRLLIPVGSCLELALIQMPGTELAAEFRAGLVILECPAQSGERGCFVFQTFPAFRQLQTGLNIILDPA